MALVLADDAFVGHGFEDAQRRAAIGVVAVEQATWVMRSGSAR